ncbi:MAG: hypothetical protein ACK5Q5_01645 [Planctomycetaceae bacterium]
MDELYEVLFLGGLGLALVGWVWLLVVAYRTHLGWGIAVTLIPPAAILFIARQWTKAKAPLGVILAGLLISAAPAIYTRVAPVDLGPHIAQVDGETHITLTGWDQQNYAPLRQWPDVVVLQMANADVTNETLRLLAGDQRLRELDISDSQVTDAGLAIVDDLPALEILRLKNCKITDAGFKEHLLLHPKLMRLELTGTQVTPEVIREWRKANPERRAMQ